MNETKKITQGALMLAIVSAMMFVNLRLGGLFDTLVILIIPVVIILYSSMNTLRDGVILSVSMGLMGLILGFAASSPSYIAYFPVSVLTGLGYSWGIRKDLKKGQLLLIAIVCFVVGEILISFLIFPLLGFPVSEMLDEIEAMMTGGNYEDMGAYGQAMEQAMDTMVSSFGGHFRSFLLIILLLTVVLTGVMEGVIIHILSIFLLKRFRIKEMEPISIYNIKGNPVIGYICMSAVLAYFIFGKNANETMYTILMISGIVGAIILIYYGYIFILLWGAIALKKNLTFLMIIALLFLLPVMLMMMVVLGFLYTTGPLRDYLDRKRTV